MGNSVVMIIIVSCLGHRGFVNLGRQKDKYLNTQILIKKSKERLINHAWDNREAFAENVLHLGLKD